jgi:hypothetical protein
MSQKRIFLDVGAFIVAARITEEMALQYSMVLIGCSYPATLSSFRFFRKPFTAAFKEEVAFYQSFFENVVESWVSVSDELMDAMLVKRRMNDNSLNY